MTSKIEKLKFTIKAKNLHIKKLEQANKQLANSRLARRDQFAMAAMQGIYACFRDYRGGVTIDALIKELDKDKDK